MYKMQVAQIKHLKANFAMINDPSHLLKSDEGVGGEKKTGNKK